MRRAVVCILIVFTIFTSFAQDGEEASMTVPRGELLKIFVRARADWQGIWQDGQATSQGDVLSESHAGRYMDDNESGFKGKYLRLCVDGEIVSGVTYSWRQRLNKSVLDGHFFDATDWLCVDYAVRNWHFNGGKQIVAIGGWEYDRNPAYLYCSSLFWENVPCFQWGASVAYDVCTRQNVLFQVSQSMLHEHGMNNIYGYSLLWTGGCGPWSALWSTNLLEYRPRHYISYISLGNRVELGPWRLEFDFLNRATLHQTFLFADCSVVGDVSYATPAQKWRLHAKVSYDVNRTHSDADMLVQRGTELTIAGAGVEFFPLRRQRTSLCVHASCYHSWGRNPMDFDMMRDGTTMLSVGLTWDMTLANLHRKKK